MGRKVLGMHAARRWLVLLATSVVGARMAMGAETLYNGIELAEPWPPRVRGLSREPMAVPYLAHPPAVVPIDVGRQLFVDDFLVAETSLERSFHRPRMCERNPVLRPQRAWEHKSRGWFAAPFSGGVWYDPADRRFKAWYCGGYLASLCYATSEDGIHWEKPALDVQPGTNVVLEPGPPGADRRRDTTTVWLDHDAEEPGERFKYFATEAGKGWALVCRASGDGVHWSQPRASQRIHGDRTTVFYNPFRKVWVVSQRIGIRGVGRARGYVEDPDPRQAVLKAPRGRYDRPVENATPWVCADRLDPHHTDPRHGEIEPQLYNLDATPYESLMLGLFCIWQGPSNRHCGQNGLQKRNDILLGFSRDGFHWHRPSRQRFIACTWEEDSWRFGNVQSVGGGCLVVGDQLYFYFSGRAKPRGQWDADAATGLAILRRDGFASMDAGAKGGTLTTRPVRFRGKHLFVNVDCPRGELRVEVLDADRRPLEPFTAEACRPVACDETRAAVTWAGADDLSAVADKVVRFRFHLRDGRLYAFWVSPQRSGASHGYVAAGGPGFAGPTDTVGDGSAGDEGRGAR
ncbi:MAG: hypothetical protein ACLF0G_16450 [Candidatus Brocadiia bacterium]